MPKKKEKELRLNHINGKKANAHGKEGEEFIKRVLPELVPINRPGADFVTRDRKHFVEVKATFSNAGAKESIMLKALNRQWMNQIADIVFFVTGTHVFFCSAEQLRGFVAANYKEFRKLRRTKGDARERFLAPLQMLKEAGFLFGIRRRNITRQNFTVGRILSSVFPKKPAPQAPKTKRGKTFAEIAEEKAARAKIEMVAKARAIQRTRAQLPQKPPKRRFLTVRMIRPGRH